MVISSNVAATLIGYLAKNNNSANADWLKGLLCLLLFDNVLMNTSLAQRLELRLFTFVAGLYSSFSGNL